MKIIFKVIFDTESGSYTADTDSVKTANDKASVEDIASKVSKMFKELSKKYYKKILQQNGYVSKLDKEEMN
jgi:hypothetical protein